MPIWMDIKGVGVVADRSGQTSPTAVGAAGRSLLSSGVSSLGADQFLQGQVVVDPADRSKLAGIMTHDGSSGNGIIAILIGLLGPSPRGFQGCNGSGDGDLVRLGVSPAGAHQFLNGQIVLNSADRSKLANLVRFRFETVFTTKID